MRPDDEESNELRPPREREGFLARGVGAALDWGRRNPVSAGWIGACLFILILVYVQALASLVDRGNGGGDDDGGHGVSEPADVPPAPIEQAPTPAPAPAPVVDPDPAETAPAPVSEPTPAEETAE